MRPMEENEFDIFINAEDAPQIAGVVDERGPVDFTDKRRWRIMADDEGGDLTVTSIVKETKQFKQVNYISDELSPSRKSKKYSDDDLSPPRISKKTKNKINKKAKGDEDSDLSPPRIKSKKHINSKHKSLQSDSDSDSSQATDISSHKIKKRAKKNKKTCDDSDLSPPRKVAKDYDSDLSPPRKSKKHKSKKSMKHRDINDLKLRPSRRDRKDSDSDISLSGRNRKDSDSDMSLPRKNKKDSDSDLSPERKNKNYESDLSPPRKSKKHKHRTKDYDSEFNPPRRNYERDVNVHMSPKRKDRNDESDYIQAWQSKKDKNSYFETKRNKYDNTLRESSPRQHKYRHEKIEKNRIDKHSETNTWFDRRHDSDMTPPRKKTRDVDISPNRFRKSDKDFYKNKSGKYNKYDNNKYNHDPRYSHREESYVREKKSKYRDVSEDNNEKRMKKTLDGKKAGLQNAKALREETEQYKQREAEHFSKVFKKILFFIFLIIIL